MKTEQDRNTKEASWPKKVVQKWLNLSSTTELFNSNYTKPSTSGSAQMMVQDGRRRKSCSDKDAYIPAAAEGRPELLGGSENMRRNRIRSDMSAVTSTGGSQTNRMFVGTWNVGGRAPHAGLNLRDWLCTPAPSDIYVLGFQEIVPLNAGNVLGTKDRIPAARWLSLIARALNFSRKPSASSDYYADATHHPDQFPKPRVSFSDLISMEDMDEEEIAEDYDEVGFDYGDESEDQTSTNSSDEESAEVFPIGNSSGRLGRRGIRSGSGYVLAGSKQMVGIFLCVWIRSHLLSHLSRVKVSCVARGVMGYMGNKGSISISMTLRSTTFCFVCTHLASGEKERDEVKRNSDVVEILRRTRFRLSRHGRSSRPALSPETILQHDKIVWLGDLNYRLNSSCEETHELLRKNDWDTLLEKDQLRVEHNAGRIFTGWEEGKIYFPPTYKYLTNSDRYAVQTATKPGEKKRTPAWCDRILWRGDGMKQICYVRGESRFSDHRPVYSIFSVREVDLVEEDNDTTTTSTTSSVNVANTTRTEKSRATNKKRWPMKTTTINISANNSSNSSSVSANSCARVQAEEMFPVARTKGCLDSGAKVEVTR